MEDRERYFKAMQKIKEQKDSIEAKAKEILKNGGLAIGVLSDDTKIMLRLFESAQKNICYYARFHRRSGYPIRSLNLVDIFPKVTKRIKTDEQVWRDSWIKVRDKLEKSGLWAELLQDIKDGLEIGYEKIQQAYKIEWEKNSETDKLSYEEYSKLRNQRIEAIDKRLSKTSIRWTMNYKAKVKKMYFGKYANEEKLIERQKALKSKTKLHQSRTVNYDVSFEYNPDIQKAWYSEEFRNCGNGHYYLALDAEYALFYEDD